MRLSNRNSLRAARQTPHRLCIHFPFDSSPANKYLQRAASTTVISSFGSSKSTPPPSHRRWPIGATAGNQ
ncbi:hypothetical protein KCP73_05920 [Salmonella enterica subsp. enterica]|nr:hypothetical protein KCP73_05920 [Salmonella enterica subsp. enterica]